MGGSKRYRPFFISDQFPAPWFWHPWVSRLIGWLPDPAHQRAIDRRATAASARLLIAGVADNQVGRRSMVSRGHQHGHVLLVRKGPLKLLGVN